MSKDSLAEPEPKSHDLDQERPNSGVPTVIATTEHTSELAAHRQAGPRRKPDHGPNDRRDDSAQWEQSRVQQSSSIKNLAMTCGLGLICGVLGAGGYLYFLSPKSNESSSSAEQSEPSAPKATAKKKKSEFSGTRTVMESNSPGAAWIPGFTSSEDAETFKAQIASIVQRLDRLTERVDRMTRPSDETPPVLRTMQIKMVELAKAVDDVASLPAKVRQCDTRLETLLAEIKSMRSRVDALASGERAALANDSPAPPPGGAATAPPAASQPPNPTMELGIKLLQRGQNASAREVFARLENAQPNDARVWYFAALAAGLASGDWEGEAKQLVEKGIERERNGSPSTAEVNAALKTRVPIEGMPWLNSLRRQALGSKTGH